LFSQFISKIGNNPNIIYEVKKQTDNGPLLSTKTFRLVHDQVEEVKGKYTDKMHVFKNYKCNKHKLFFGVDLYKNKEGTNFHHMRLNPFTKINESMLEKFFESVF
jgi:hypothetical protein